MKKLDREVADLRSAVEQLKRELARKEARPSMPLAARRGWFLGVSRKTFTQGVDQFVELDLYTWTQGKWRKAVLEAPGFIRARDWYLNKGDTLEKKTKLKVEHYETTWVVTGMYCSPTDLDEFKESPMTGSPGEGESAGDGSFLDASQMSWSDFASAGGSGGSSFGSGGGFDNAGANGLVFD